MADETLLQQALRAQKGTYGLEIHNVKEVQCTKPGDNYMSKVAVLEVEGTLPEGVPYSGSVFVKRQFQSRDLRQMFQSEDAFYNEVIMYNDVLPSYDVAVPCARCVFASSDVIYLENLKAVGYNMATRDVGFDLAQATLILKALARLHVASYHALLTRNEQFTTAVNKLKPISFITSTQKKVSELSLRKWIIQLEGQELDTVVSFLQDLKGCFNAHMDALKEPTRIKVLCHGDFWLNNILIREDEDPVRIVDLQNCSVLSPAVDVWSFLYSSIQPSTMESGIPRLVDAYCTAFTEELTIQRVPRKGNISPEDLKEELRSRELYGYLIGIIFTPALFVIGENIPNAETIPKEAFLENCLLDDFISPNIKERILHLSRLGLTRALFIKKQED